MVEAGSQPNSVTYSCLIHGLCNVGTVDEALELIKEMVEKGLGPMISTYTLPLTSLCEAGRLTEHMLQDSVVTLMNGYCKLGNLNNAMRLLNFMQENGCEPDEWTFTELICGFFKMGTLVVALDLFNKMAVCGLNPHKNRLPEAEKLCREIAEQGLFPTVVTYTNLIDGLCKSGATSLAFKVVDEMMKHDCLPNLHTYSSLIYGLCQEANAMEAELLFKVMQRKGLIPDLVTYTSVIDGPYGVLLKGLQKDQDFLEEDHIDGYLSTGKARGSTIVAGLLDRLLENGCGTYFDTYVTLLMERLADQIKYTAEQLGTGTALPKKKKAAASAALEYGQKHNIRRIISVRDVVEALLLIYARSDESRRSICGPHAIRAHDLVDKTEHIFTV
ncbi:pentatricopeptide repeat-containing protein At1g09900-like [Aristolochia californica]|uniref:pentatricopeptide repeat-containing protein At1g09900-like n=1 Tax=Aristolochia californica TaxID=171875 RepID=UPI0035D9CBF9